MQKTAKLCDITAMLERYPPSPLSNEEKPEKEEEESRVLKQARDVLFMLTRDASRKWLL